MQLSHKVLPASKSIHVQSLPLLFEVASNFQDQVLRHIATSAFRFIDTLSRTTTGNLPERYDTITTVVLSEIQQVDILMPRIFSILFRPHEGWGQRNIDRIKFKIGTQMDEVSFRSLLNETQVHSRILKLESLRTLFTRWLINSFLSMYFV